MSSSLEQLLAPGSESLLSPEWADVLPRTKDGRIKRKLTWEEKVRLLDPASPREVTEARLMAFRNLFAFRVTEGIITRVGQGPRAWLTLQGRLYLDNIVRHLLGDRVPTQAPQWVGARSFDKSYFAVIDVDADREGKRRRRAVVAGHSRRKGRRRRPFEERCRQVEHALGRLGIDLADPDEILVVPSPGGGRHYFIFFDKPYFLDQYRWLWESLELVEEDSQIEFYPRENKAFRLPFGHLQQHDHWTWSEFIDSYTSGRIRRFSLQELYNNERLNRPSQPSATKPPRARPAPVRRTAARSVSSSGMPKRARVSAKVPDSAVERYRQLVQQDKHSFQEVEELKGLGILLPGTRTSVLKILAAHMVWFLGLSAADAAQELTTWAYTHGHESKDIEDDLQRGTIKVATQIDLMCRWYAEHKRPEMAKSRQLFARTELAALRPHIQLLPPEERDNQAHFYLSFLRFAKLHGQEADNQAGWVAAPAVKPVIRGWTGCHHMHYKQRMKRAEEAGLFKMVKEKWQPLRGPGRARTYHLAVPVVPRGEWVLDYDAALVFLTEEKQPTHRHATTHASEAKEGSPSDEPIHGPASRDSGVVERGDHPAAVRQACSGSDLESSPRECPEKPDAALGVPDQADGVVRALSSTATGAAERKADEARRTGICFKGKLIRQSSRRVVGGRAAPDYRADARAVRDDLCGNGLPATREVSFEEQERLIIGLDQDEGHHEGKKQVQRPMWRMLPHFGTRQAGKGETIGVLEGRPGERSTG